MTPVDFNFEQGKQVVQHLFQYLEDVAVAPRDIWRTVQGNDIHPLARWIRAAEEFYVHDGLPSVHQVQITRLAGDIQVLHGVSGLDERVRKLCSGIEADFYATYHEITTAARYAHAGIHVAFIPTSRSKSPDLLLNDEVEIECKSRARDLASSIRYRSLCHDVLGRLSQLVSQREDAVGILADLRLKGALPTGWVSGIVNDAKLLLEGSGSYPVLSQSATLGHRLKRYPPILLTEPGPNDPTVFAAGADYVRWRGTAVPDHVRNGTYLSSFVQVSVKGLDDEPVWNLRNVLKSAARQLSGTRASIIEVEVTPETSRLFQQDDGTLMQDVASIFRNYRRVSAVRLVTRYSVRRPDGLKMGQFLLEFPNDRARTSVPSWLAMPVVDGTADLSTAQVLD